MQKFERPWLVDTQVDPKLLEEIKAVMDEGLCKV